MRLVPRLSHSPLNRLWHWTSELLESHERSSQELEPCRGFFIKFQTLKSFASLIWLAAFERRLNFWTTQSIESFLFVMKTCRVPCCCSVGPGQRRRRRQVQQGLNVYEKLLEETAPLKVRLGLGDWETPGLGKGKKPCLARMYVHTRSRISFGWRYLCKGKLLAS